MDNQPVVTTTLQTTSSSASTSSSEAGSHRNCSVCKKRISNYKFDKHTVCISCRAIKCDLDHRCDECKDWKKEEMESYLKHRKSLETKSKKKDHSPALTTPSTSKQPVELDFLKAIEDKISKKVETLFDSLLGNLDDVVDSKITRSLAAPSKVPEPASDNRGAGGDAVDSGSWRPRLTDPLARCL